MNKLARLLVLISAVCFAVGPDVFHATTGSAAAEYWILSGGNALSYVINTVPGGYVVPATTNQKLTLTALDCITSTASSGTGNTVFNAGDVNHSINTCTFTIPCTTTNAAAPVVIRTAATTGLGNGCVFDKSVSNYFQLKVTSVCGTSTFSGLCSVRGKWQ